MYYDPIYYAPSTVEREGQTWHRDAQSNRSMGAMLIPVDGSDRALRAVAHLAGIVDQRDRPIIHLLNVQPPITSADILSTVSAGMVQTRRLQAGENVMSRARNILDLKGLVHRSVILFGEPAEVIIRYAQDHGIGGIVMGTRGMSALKSLLLGSTATRVVSATGVPVTLVK